MNPLKIHVAGSYDQCLQFMLKQRDTRNLDVIALFFMTDEKNQNCIIILCPPNQGQVLTRILGNKSSVVVSNDPRAWERMVKYTGTFKELCDILMANFNQTEFAN